MPMPIIENRQNRYRACLAMSKSSMISRGTEATDSRRTLLDAQSAAATQPSPAQGNYWRRAPWRETQVFLRAQRQG